jgi:hypothetical protein
MSELGYISKRYNRISKLTDDINNASITVKKHSLLQEEDSTTKYPKLKIGENDYLNSKDKLIEFIEAIIQLIEEGKSNTDIKMLAENKAYTSQISKNPELKQELKNLLQCLKQNKALLKDQFKLLDTIIGVLDNERSYLFRKMRNISE